MREYPSLIGKRFGKLTVIEQAESRSGQRRWLCQCDCGGTHVATTGNLNNGHTTNCGCKRSPDLSGRVFGRIFVLRRTEKKRRRGDRMLAEWECRCECGATVFRTADQLTDEKERMCADCARKRSASKAFEVAGFEQGTQIGKIKEMKKSASNTSGCRGVYWHKKQKKWVARLKFRGKIMNFGSYSEFEDAVKARQRAEEEYFEAFLTAREEQDA